MAGLVEAARLLWCQGLAQISGKPDGSLHDWLGSATYAPSVSGKALILGGIDSADLLKAFGCDINRLASAASETLRNVAEIPTVPKSMAWPYVKLYYSALFYSHSLLRVWGRSPSYFRTTDLIPLRNIVDTYGVSSPFPLSTGQFLLVADPGGFQAVLAPEKGGGGSHDAVWRELVRAVGDLKVAVAGSQFLEADKKSITSKLELAVGLITNGGANAAWPSYMRNEIHYRQSSGVWYPYTGKSKTSDLSVDISKVLSGGIEASSLLGVVGDDLVRFRAACLFLVALTRDVLADLSSVGGPKTFLSFGQSKFEMAYP
jgi:hypothetical protein